MSAHGRICGHGQKFKANWDKERAKTSKKAQKKMKIFKKPLS